MVEFLKVSGSHPGVRGSLCGFILLLMAGGPRSKKIVHRGSAGERKLRTTALGAKYLIVTIIF